VSVYGGQLRKQGVISGKSSAAESIPMPRVASIDDDSFAIMIAGIGGTGVITVGSILAMAAHIEGKAASTYDMTGLAQKGGAVYSHLRIAKDRSDILAQRIGKNETDLILAFDTLAALSGDSLQSLSSGKSQFVGNSSVTPTAGFQRDPDLRIDSKAIEDKVLAILGTDRCHFSEATRIALALCGDTIATNFFLVGYAVQLGFMPLGIDAIEQAIRLNGVSVDFNLRALGLGRRYGHNPEQVLNQLSQSVPQGSTETLSSIRDYRSEMLRSYQSDAYADEYCRFVDLVVAKENQAGVESQRFSMGVAKSLAKLMAYKDEYEVARLYSSDEFKRKLSATFDGEYSLKFNLAPPMLARKDPETGLPKTREFG
ncbi:MAG: DUF6537 domain-containing protein, partial [Pseudomonadota bacterium]|nr:DUF6537 domain-containing protein [Pseudomonadota bacterium]